MRYILFHLLFVFSIFTSFAQNSKVQFDLSAGFELPENVKLETANAKGYNVSFDIKYYVHNHIYALGSVYTAKMKGKEPCLLYYDGEVFDGEKRNDLVNTFLGLGAGCDFLKIKRHTAYVQASFGIAAEYFDSEKQGNHIAISEFEHRDYAIWGLVGKIGYSYRLNKWLGIGAAYNVNWFYYDISQGFQGGVQVYF